MNASLPLNSDAAGPVISPHDGGTMSVDIGGTAINFTYSQYGVGECVLLMHGWLHTKEIWNKVIPELLATVPQVLVIDLPGFGDSPAPPTTLQSLSDYSLMVRRLLEKISANTQLRAVVADSFSARIILEILKEGHQWECKRFLLSGCPFDGLPWLLKLVQATPVPRLLVRLIKALPRWAAEAIVDSFAWYTLRKREGNMAPIYAGAIASDPEVARNMLRALSSRAGIPARLKLKDLEIRLLRGQFDRLVSHASQARWARRLGATTIEIPGVGHTPMLEASKLYSGEIAKLLE